MKEKTTEENIAELRARIGKIEYDIYEEGEFVSQNEFSECKKKIMSELEKCGCSKKTTKKKTK